MIRMEREVDEEFRPVMHARLVQRIAEFDASAAGIAPRCGTCGRAMKSKGQRPAPSLLTRFGELSLTSTVYRCKPYKQQIRPLWERLGVEAGQVSGSLARLLALLGVVVPYEMAARLCLEYLRLGCGIGSAAIESARRSLRHTLPSADCARLTHRIPVVRAALDPPGAYHQIPGWYPRLVSTPRKSRIDTLEGRRS